MLLTLNDEDKETISVLHELSPDVLGELCLLAVDSLDKGINQKVQQAAAKKLQLQPEVVQQTVNGVLFLFTESSKHHLSELDFHDSMLAIGFDAEVCKVLTQQYVLHEAKIRNILLEMSPGLPQYHNLEWRLDVQLASRSLHRQVVPQILLKLHTKDGDKDEIKVFQTDPVNLLHLTASLEEALEEVKMAHCRRILRNL